MERKNVRELIRKYQDGTCSPAEKQLLEMHLVRYLGREGGIPSEDLLEHAAANNFSAIMAAIKPAKAKFRYHWYAAAVLLLALATALYFYRSGSIVHRKSDIVNEIGPGRNRATLTLADGTKVNLDSTQSGIVIQDEHIKYQSGESLAGVILSVAEVSHKAGETRSTQPALSVAEGLHSAQGDVLLTLTTPKGGQYQIILSDGTKVWLNSATTLKYPSRFSGDTRTVELEGEAYFAVNNTTVIPSAVEGSPKKGRGLKPFIVKSNNQQITVIGTEFNLSSYNDEKETKTTLVNGSIRVDGRTLLPGQQSIMTHGRMEVKNVDTDSEISWKNGAFNLEDKSLEDFMHEVARWYNIAVIFEGPVPPVEFTGSIGRNKNLSNILQLLKSSDITYRFRDQRTLIIVNKSHTE